MKEKLKKEEIGFTQVKNEILNDKNLSWKAKGLFAYLYSKPEDWDFSAIRMSNDSLDGNDSTFSGLKELENAGYLVRMKTASGRVEYCIYWSKKPIRENPKQGKSLLGKIGSISNKDSIVTKNKTNKEVFSYEKTADTYKSKQKIANQKGIKLKRTPRSIKQEQTIDALKMLTYYRDKAQEIHGMQFFKVQDESRNKAVRKLIIRAAKECNLKDLIDWWIDGAGEWAGYEPENCFSTRIIERFKNKGKAKKSKHLNLNDYE